MDPIFQQRRNGSGIRCTSKTARCYGIRIWESSYLRHCSLDDNQMMRITIEMSRSVLIMLCLSLVISGCTPTFNQTATHEVAYVASGIELAWTHSTSSPIKEMVTDESGQFVYLLTMQGVEKVDLASGRLLWQTNLNKHGTMTFAYDAQLLLVQNVLVANDENAHVLVGLDAEDGQVIWRLRFSDHISGTYGSSPQVRETETDGLRVFVAINADRSNTILSIDPISGDLLWTSEDYGHILSLTQLAVWQDALLVIANPIVVFDRSTGHLVRTIEPSTIASRYAPVFQNDILYETDGSTLTALDLNNNRIIWSQSWQCSEFSLHRPPVITNNAIYQETLCSNLVKIDSMGQTLWSYSVEASSKAFVAAESQGYLLTSKTEIHQIDLLTGEGAEIIRFSPPRFPGFGDQTFQYLRVTENRLLVHLDNNQLFGFSIPYY